MVFQMPLHHPMRLAQDTALIDQLSRGRFDFAIGYGTRLGEFAPWDLDFKERRAMGLEAMEVVLKAWTQEKVSHEGKFWRFKDASPQPQPLPEAASAGLGRRAQRRPRSTTRPSIISMSRRTSMSSG